MQKEEGMAISARSRARTPRRRGKPNGLPFNALRSDDAPAGVGLRSDDAPAGTTLKTDIT